MPSMIFSNGIPWLVLCEVFPESMLMLVQAVIPCRWTNDSQHFLLKYFDMIYQSPAQMYQLALPFCPSFSWLHKYYTAEQLQVVKVVKGLPAEWGMCSRTVVMDTLPQVLSCWNNTIAVGSYCGIIKFLNAITGSKLAVLSKHTKVVLSLTFSLDGTLLVSGSGDKTVILWDVQTGGVVKLFCGHVDYVHCVSISMDYTTIASGSGDQMIRLWDIQTGECYCVIDRHEDINSVSFSPTNSQLLISGSNVHMIEQWNTRGYKIGSTYEGSYGAFSPDGTCFISWGESAATVRNSDSGAIITKLQLPSGKLRCCCISPDSKFVAGIVGSTIYVWDITGADPYLIQTIGCAARVASLIFSSSLISASIDASVRFWQIGIRPTNTTATEITSTVVTPTKIQSASLQARDGIAITTDIAGEMKTWDIATGLCKTSFQTPAKGCTWRDAQLIEGRLVLAWWGDDKIHIWEAEKEEPVWTVDTSFSGVNGIRISGDGSKVFCLSGKSILAWSMQTGDSIGTVELEDQLDMDPLCADGSKIWVHLKSSSLLQGWDFGRLGLSPIPLSNIPLNRPHLDLIDGHKWWRTHPNKVKDTVTGKEVFELSGRYGSPSVVQWDGQYLVTGYHSGEVLILDFKHVLPN